MSVKIDLKNENNILKIFIEGTINENFIAPDIHDIKSINEIQFYLGKIKSINSSGLKIWLSFMDKLKGTNINYHETPIAFISQMNMVNGFFNNKTKVVSFYAPYFDEKNNSAVVKLLNAHDIKNNKAPLFKNNDGELLVFDSFEESYFLFLELMNK